MTGKSLALDDEHVELRASARSFLAARSPVEDVRRLRDDPARLGVKPEVWSAMAEMEWPGMAVGADVGGVGAGYFELGILFEELGRNLVLSPLLAVCQALTFLSRDHQGASAVIPKVLSGDALVVLAHQESAVYDPTLVRMTARPTPGGYALDGEKNFVLYGDTSDTYVVSARLSGAARDRGGIALFLVDRSTDGVAVSSLRLMDSQPRAHVSFDDVQVDDAQLLADGGEASAMLATSFNVGTALLASEMVGSLQAAMELTVDYLKQREQFGAIIGSFQALQHRAARMLVASEMATSVVRAALRAVDDDPETAGEAVSAAKAWANDGFTLIAREGVQLHGGLGMTDEANIGLYLKRAQVAAAQWGGSSFHRRQLAAHKLGIA